MLDIGVMAPVAGLVGLAFAFFSYVGIVKQSPGTDKMKAIADEIHLGAMTFLRAEYSKLAVFVVFVAALMGHFFGWQTSMAFVLGALASASAGFIGMQAATKGNVRTAAAAKDKGVAAALLIAFNGGAVMGLSVASLGLIGLGALYFVFGAELSVAQIVSGFSMGASSIALFARIGGGIFTKAADVGSDLVGKVEAGIPEDDPRNPGVIADNVGDNVGDVAGMGADIFESYVGAMVASLTIAATMTQTQLTEHFQGDVTREMLMGLPLILSVIGLVCSVIGILGMNVFKNMNPAKALTVSELTAGGLFLAGAAAFLQMFGYGMDIFLAIMAGTVGGILIGKVTEYYTASKPVFKIAEASKTGPATTVIAGMAVGLESCAGPLMLIAASIYTSYMACGLYGIAMAAVGMLAKQKLSLLLSKPKIASKKKPIRISMKPEKLLKRK